MAEHDREFIKAELRAKVFEAREIAGGKGVSVRVSINPARKNKDGEWEKRFFLNVIVWHKGLLSYAAGLQKDAIIHVEGGRIEENKFTKDGVERVTWQVVLPPFDCDIDRQLGTFGEKELAPAARPTPRGNVPFELPDEIPF